MTQPYPNVLERLREQIIADHVRGCQGREYHCDCGYDLKTEGMLEMAADEIERLRAAAWGARLALDLALLADGLGSDIKKRLRTAWLKVGDALGRDVQTPPSPLVCDHSGTSKSSRPR